MSRLLFVHEHSTLPGLGGGGAESGLRDQAEGLKRLGHEVAVLFDGQIERAIDAYKPDVVHLGTIHVYHAFKEALWLAEQRIPAVWQLHDYWPFCEPRMCLVGTDVSCSAVTDVCNNQCGGYVPQRRDLVSKFHTVVGNEYSARILRRNGIRIDSVVECGIDVDLFSPAACKAPPEHVYATTAWSWHPVKGVKYLAEAVKGTPYTARLLTGLPRSDVARELGKARVYANPSCYEETWCLSLTEAMACGCACVATDVAGPRAQLHGGEYGLLVPPRDPGWLRECLRALVDNEQMRRDLGEAARAHVVEDHSLEAMARRWEAVYAKVRQGAAVCS